MTQDKLNKLQRKAERPRLDGEPTRAQIKAMVRRTRRITPMQSARVIDEITRAMMEDI